MSTPLFTARGSGCEWEESLTSGLPKRFRSNQENPSPHNSRRRSWYTVSLVQLAPFDATPRFSRSFAKQQLFAFVVQQVLPPLVLQHASAMIRYISAFRMSGKAPNQLGLTTAFLRSCLNFSTAEIDEFGSRNFRQARSFVSLLSYILALLRGVTNHLRTSLLFIESYKVTDMNAGA